MTLHTRGTEAQPLQTVALVFCPTRSRKDGSISSWMHLTRKPLFRFLLRSEPLRHRRLAGNGSFVSLVPCKQQLQGMPSVNKLKAPVLVEDHDVKPLLGIHRGLQPASLKGSTIIWDCLSMKMARRQNSWRFWPRSAPFWPAVLWTMLRIILLFEATALCLESSMQPFIANVAQAVDRHSGLALAAACFRAGNPTPSSCLDEQDRSDHNVLRCLPSVFHAAGPPLASLKIFVPPKVVAQAADLTGRCAAQFWPPLRILEMHSSWRSAPKCLF